MIVKYWLADYQCWCLFYRLAEMGDEFIKSQDLNRRMQRSKSDSYSLYGGDKSRYVHNHHRAKYRYHGKSHCTCIYNGSVSVILSLGRWKDIKTYSIIFLVRFTAIIIIEFLFKVPKYISPLQLGYDLLNDLCEW